MSKKNKNIFSKIILSVILLSVSVVGFLFVKQEHYSTNKEELLREYFEISKTKEIYQDTIGIYVDQDIADNPNVNTEEKYNYYNSIMGWEFLEEDSTRIFNENFTAQELQDLIRFYKTPIGKKFAEKSPLINTEISKVILKNMKEYEQKNLSKKLEDFVNQISKSLPIMVDQQMRFDSLKLIDGMLVNKYTFVNHSSSKIDENMRRPLRLGLIRNFCNNPDISFLRDGKVTVLYDYFGNDNNKVLSVKLDYLQCN